ncbi:unnamed protein product [Phytophthora lilii]|uniref:Unnamed protein product n=1 Tax=Phytophthora lilii TaxID=2077276 RepID=A0A9W6UD14_9STRA|nr:unnamed protein product [Phytophthora lilii]
MSEDQPRVTMYIDVQVIDVSTVEDDLLCHRRTALEAWEALKAFFVKQSFHNRVQLRKQLHEFTLGSDEDLMTHIVRFDDLCARLAAVGEKMTDDEKVVILLGSLPQEYDTMVRIIESQEHVTLLDTKEMLRREAEVIQKRDTKEQAFRASINGQRNRGRGRGNGRRRGYNRGVQATRTQEGELSKFEGKSSDEYVFSATSTLVTDKVVWILDSGASSHMSGDQVDFDDFRELTEPIDITVANGQRLRAAGVGSVKLIMEDGVKVTLTDVLFVPHLDRKLMSISALTARGVGVHFEADTAVLSFRGRSIARIPRIGKLFALEAKLALVEEANQAVVSQEHGSDAWHARLGHVTDKKLKLISVAYEDLKIRDDDGTGLCEGCEGDVMGPLKPKSKEGAQYIVTFIDDFSRFVQVYLIASKNLVFQRLVEFTALVKTQYRQRVKCIRTDNGGEYTSKRFDAFCRQEGIIHQTSAPYSPQQNGLAERMNRTLTEMARSIVVPHESR